MGNGCDVDVDADATGNDDDDDDEDDDVTVDIWHYIVVWIHHYIHQIEPNHTSIHSFVEPPLGLIGITYFHSIAALI